MKNNIKLWKKIVGCCLLAVLMYNCADDSYLIDGGKANPYYNCLLYTSDAADEL